MRIRCAAAHTHLIYTMTWSAQFWQKTLLGTLHSPLEGRQTPWLSKWSSHKRTMHLFCRPCSSRRILRCCASCKSPILPFRSSSSGNQTRLFRGSASRNNWSSVQSNKFAVQSQLLKDRKLANGTSSRLNWVPHVSLMFHLSVEGI